MATEETPTNRTARQELLVSRVTEYVKDFMRNYDSSHDFAHIERVLVLALSIASSTPGIYDLHVVTLSALLHDVGDRKYLRPGDNAETMIQDVLLSFDADEALASKVQRISSAVSYTSEVRDPAFVQRLIAELPELAPVQDADRLDAIGAIGIGRLFTYGGAHGGKMEECMEIFTSKLEKLEGIMKTERGRELARARTTRLKVFRGWWAEEEGDVQ